MSICYQGKQERDRTQEITILEGEDAAFGVFVCSWACAVDYCRGRKYGQTITIGATR